MCQFFSFVTEPEGHGGKRFYFDWKYRKAHLKDEQKTADSHSMICKHFGLDEDKCNKYEFDPQTKKFVVDGINSPTDDRIQAEDWVNRLDFERVVEPLIIKPIVNPFELPLAEATEQDIHDLKLLASVWESAGTSVRASVGTSVWESVRASVWESVGTSVRASVGTSVWASVWASVWESVGTSVGASVGTSVWASVRTSVWTSVWESAGTSVRASVGTSVWESVRASVWESVRASVWAYTSSFFTIEYKYDFSPAVRLWERGIVASFDGKTWRLHSGKDAQVIYQINKEELETL